jgi:dipeptidase
MGDIAVELGFFSEDSGDPAKPGYSGSSECLGVADATGELWIFNILTGKNNASSIWAAQRLPSDAVVAVGNSFTIRKMNLSDSENFLYSPGVSELAVEKGWWSPKDESSPDIFDFYSAYGYTPGALGEQPVPPNLGELLGYYSSRRMWRIYSLLSPAEGAKLDRYKSNLPKTQDPLPCWVSAPKGSVTLEMVQNAYRDHYEGTEFDLTQGMSAGPFGNPNRGPGPPGVVGLWERAVSMYRTTWSFVNEARPEGRSVLWFGYDAPHGTVYLPFYGAASDAAPQSYHSHEGTMGKFSFDLAYWPFAIINSFSEVNFQLINGDVRQRATAIEGEALRQRQLWEAEAARAATEEEALEVLTRRSNAFAADVVSEWWDYAFSLFAKFGRKAITFNDTDQGALAQRYPAWWVESPSVGYTIWSAEGPFHGISEAEQLARANQQKAVCTPTLLAATGTSPAQLTAAGFMAAVAAVSLYVAGLRHGRQSAQVEGYVACA